MRRHLSPAVRIARAVALACLAACPASAADGVLEIDPACVIVGCFDGDTPNYPIQITHPGSYKLTGNLDLGIGGPGSQDRSAIQVNADGVTIDLAGFAILGPVICSTPPVNCSNTGSGIGIQGTVIGLTVKNGTITGLGSNGIFVLGEIPRFENLTLFWNGGAGLQATGLGAQVVNVNSSWNGGTGIWVGQGGSVRRSTAALNKLNGLAGSADVLYVDNTTYQNGMQGIAASGRSLFARNVVNDNGAAGINDNGSGSLAFGNTIAENTQFGIAFGAATSAYTENVFSNNAASVLSGVSLTQNLCNGANC
jgi:hypothetical protein